MSLSIVQDGKFRSSFVASLLEIRTRAYAFVLWDQATDISFSQVLSALSGGSSRLKRRVRISRRLRSRLSLLAAKDLIVPYRFVGSSWKIFAWVGRRPL